VASSDPDIDPVGACVGMKGSRVQNVVQELRGEKIDIIPWHADSAKYVCNALAPAEISRVIIDEAHMSMEVIVPDDHLSVAIGKRGQNVRLASKLTGWSLDVQSETRYSEAMKDGYDSLVALPNVGISLADALYEQGYYSAEELAKASIEDLVLVRGIAEARATELIEIAAKEVAEAKAAAAAEAQLDDGGQQESEAQDTESAPESSAEAGVPEEEPEALEVNEPEAASSTGEEEPETTSEVKPEVQGDAEPEVQEDREPETGQDIMEASGDIEKKDSAGEPNIENSDSPEEKETTLKQ
jgi:N utilization substance protein A